MIKKEKKVSETPLVDRQRPVSMKPMRQRAFTIKPEGRHRPIALKMDASGIERKSSMQTYGNLIRETTAFVDKLKRVTSDLSVQTIQNVVSYTRQLIKSGKDEIDENIFVAQMAKYFKITDAYLLSRIYDVIKCKKKQNCVILNYAKLVCIFISDDIVPKIDYAFRVYDVRSTGYLNISDLEAALRPLIQYTHVSSVEEVLNHHSAMDLTNEDTEKKTLTEIVNLLLTMIDTNNDRTIDLDEFHEIVRRYPLMLECLGPCLPEKADRDEFLQLVHSKSAFEVSAYFRHERKTSLNDPTSDGTIYDRLYPFQLEFP